MDELSLVFGALADPTRRAILNRLTRGEATVAELAKPFSITMPAVSKHIKVLESAGLIKQRVVAQTRPCRVEAESLKKAATYIEPFRSLWDGQFDRLADYLEKVQAKELPHE